MKLLAFIMCIMLSGCGTYMTASAGTFAATGKGIGDHVSSASTGNDCDTVKFVRNRQDYYCEVARDPGTTYNRSAF